MLHTIVRLCGDIAHRLAHTPWCLLLQFWLAHPGWRQPLACLRHSPLLVSCKPPPLSSVPFHRQLSSCIEITTSWQYTFAEALQIPCTTQTLHPAYSLVQY